METKFADYTWGTYEMVNPALIVVDHSFQREQKKDVIQAIAENPDPRAFGVPVCFRRDNGVFYCADGQQRIAGVMASKQRPKEIPIVWFPMPGVKEEAEIYWLINVFRKQLTPLEKHKGAVVAEHPADTTIAKVVDELGYSIGKSTGSSRSIGAIGALHSIYNLGGEQLLRDTLVVVANAWPDNRAAFERKLLRAVADIVDRDHKNGGYSRPKLTSALGAVTPGAIGRKAEEIHFDIGTSKEESTKRAIFALCPTLKPRKARG